MPAYEYRCLDCKERITIHQTYEDYGVKKVRCPACRSEKLQRIIGRVRVTKSDDAYTSSFDDMSAGGGFDESDPQSMARMMRKMSTELGEEIPPELDEVVGRLEAGESPEEIEKSMPDLGAEEGMDPLG